MQLSPDEKRLVLEARRVYHREWRAKNKERVQEYNSRYWLRKSVEMKQKDTEDNKNV